MPDAEDPEPVPQTPPEDRPHAPPTDRRDRPVLSVRRRGRSLGRRRRREAAERAVPDLRRPEQPARLLRRSAGQDAEHRPAGGPRRAVRAGLLPVPALRPEPQLDADGPAIPTAPASRPTAQIFRQTIPSHVSLPQAFRHVGLFRRADRQAVSLQRAEVDRHQRARRPRVVGAGVEPGRRRPPGRRAADLHADARPVRRHAELVRLAQGGPVPHRRPDGRRRRVGARTLRQAEGPAVLPGRRLLPAAHAVCLAEDLLRPLSREGDAGRPGREGGPGRHPARRPCAATRRSRTS